MSYDILKGARTNADWSCGAGDLPDTARGYAPESFWGPAEMERKLDQIMSKGVGPFGIGPKPTRAEALVDLVKHMKTHKIGPRDVTSGIGAEVGNILFPRALSEKIDDVRYDVRNIGGGLAKGIFALAGAFAFLAFVNVYRSSESRART